MSLASVLLPLFVQVALTFVLLLWTGNARAGALRSNQAKVSDIALGEGKWPARVMQIGNNYNNQLQLPVLFYVLVILAWITRKADLLFVVMSWIFVISRIAHAWIHTTTNEMRLRFYGFATGAAVLLIMWVIFAVRILLAFSMTPSARISASIEVLADIETRHRPATDALKDWGLSHRFAGSGDRAAIAGLAYDALRRKASTAFLMQDAGARANLIGMLRLQRDLSPEQITALFDGSRFAPASLTDAEQHALAQNSLAGAPPHVLGDYPEWLDAHLARTFGEARAEEGAALAQRAPLDLRVNTLVADRDKAAAALAHLAITSTQWSPLGLRLTPGPDAKSPAIQSEPAFLKGMIEVQDEGSQVAALLTGAAPGEQVVDLCAGGGGKTLSLAAMMENHGQIFATDLDKRRLAPIHARLERAGARDVQVRTPRGGRGAPDPLADLHGRIDLVVIDAPCTGTGTWRRNPDAKWRVRPGALTQRVAEQVEVLDRAAALVKPGGRIGYITCSVLAEEGPDQVAAFLTRHAGFRPEPAPVEQALGAAAADFRTAVLSLDHGLLMTPYRTSTDGFFVSILRRAA